MAKGGVQRNQVRPGKLGKSRSKGVLIFVRDACYKPTVVLVSPHDRAREEAMQVVLLCGGQGTRIRDVADDIPKPMIPIGGRPILWHIMKGFAQHGFTDFILCLGYKSWIIKRYFLDYHLANVDFRLRLLAPEQVQVCGQNAAEDWRLTLAETGADAMTGCRVKRIEKYITGDTFLLTYGDGVADVNIRKLVAFHKSHGKIGTVTAVQPPGRFGEIELNGAQVIEFNEKPLLSRGRVNGGFFVFQRRLFDRLDDDPGLVFEQAPLMHLAREGELMAYGHDGFWHPMDNSRDYRYLNDLWAAGQAPWNCWAPPRLRAAA
jgi:glucose-1-phosphate cytidylyltransferase